MNPTPTPRLVPDAAIAWHTEDHLTDKSATTYDPAVAERWRKKGWPVTPLYAAAPPAEAPAERGDSDAVKPFAWCRAYDNDGEPVDEIVWGSERPADWSEGSPCYRKCDVAAAAFSLAEQRSMTRKEAWKLAWDEVKKTPLSQVGDLWQATEKRCNEILAANGGGEP